MTSAERRPESVLFVCTDNTCRSVFAEYLARSHPTLRFGPRIRIESAGIRLALQKTVSPTVETLGLLFGIDASDHRPRSFASVDARDIEIIVAIDDPGRIDVKQYLIQSGVPPSKITAWEVRDPFGGDASKYDHCALATIHRLAELRRTIFRAPSAKTE